MSIGEAGIIEAKLAHRLAQILEARRIDGEETGKHHGLRRLEAGQGARPAGFFSSVTVSPTRVSATCLIAAVKKPISPGPRLVHHFLFRAARCRHARSDRSRPSHMSLTRWPFLSSPSTMRSSTTTPR